MKYQILGLLMILSLIGISGCIWNNTIDLNQTFSKEGLTFKYPSNYEETELNSSYNNGSNQAAVLGILIDKNDISGHTFIQVNKILLKGNKVSDAYYVQKQSITTSQYFFLLLTDTMTTVNGIKFYELSYSASTDSGNEIKGIELIFGKDGDVAYVLQINGLSEDYKSTYNLTQEIKNTIELQ